MKNNMGVIHYRPGDPGFEAMAAQVTDIKRVKKGYSQSSNNLTADVTPVESRRRKEPANELR